MIAKKNPRYDLERKRTAFFQVGLLTVGSFTLAAFVWQSPLITKEKKVKKQGEISSVMYELEIKPEMPKPQKNEMQKQQAEDNSMSIDTKQEVDLIDIGI